MADTAYVSLTHGRINGVDQTCVHARLLHQYLHNPIRFLKWFRIKRQALGFVCHVHYEPSFEALPGMPAAENFLLTLQAATVLMAAEDSDQGQQLCRCLLAASSQQDMPATTRANVSQLQTPTITTAQAKMLKELADERVHDTGLPYQTIWAELKHQFGIRSYLDLCAEKFESAIDFLSRPPLFSPKSRNSWYDEDIVLPENVLKVIESYSLDLSVDCLPLLRLILRNYIFQHTDTTSLDDSRYVHELLAHRFRDIEDCLAWANRRG